MCNPTWGKLSSIEIKIKKSYSRHFLPTIEKYSIKNTKQVLNLLQYIYISIMFKPIAVLTSLFVIPSFHLCKSFFLFFFALNKIFILIFSPNNIPLRANHCYYHYSIMICHCFTVIYDVILLS